MIIELSDKEEEQVDVEKALMNAFAEDIKSQGLEEAVKKAREEHEDLYIGSIRDKFFAFRPLYFDERIQIDTDLREGKIEDFTQEDLARKCVVVGLDNIIGKRPRAGIWQALARRIDEIGDYDTDLPANANPKADELPL